MTILFYIIKKSITSLGLAMILTGLALAQTVEPAQSIAPLESTPESTVSPEPEPAVGLAPVEALSDQEDLDQAGGTLAPSQPITDQDLIGSTGGRFGRSVFWQRLTGIFAFNPIKRLKIENRIASLGLVKARAAAQAGQEDRAGAAIESYNRQLARVEEQIKAAADNLANDDPKVQAILDQLAEQRIIEAASLDQLSLKATRQFNKKLVKARIGALKGLAKTLENSKLSPERRAEKLDKITSRLAQKESQADQKLAKRLGVLAALDRVSDDPLIERALSQVEIELVDQIVKRSPESIGQIVSALPGSIQKHLAVLEHVLAKAPESAKGSISQIIDRQTSRLTELVEEGKIEIDSASGHLTASTEIKQKILERLEQKTVKAQQKVRQALEQERRRERQQSEPKPSASQAEEPEAKRSSQSQDQDKSGPRSKSVLSASPSPTPSPDSGTQHPALLNGSDGSNSSSGSSESKTHLVRYQDGRFDTSGLPEAGLKPGDRIEFENKDDQPIQIQSNPHPLHTGFSDLNIGRLDKGGKKTVSFPSLGTFGWHNHLSPSQTGSVTLK